MVDISLRKTQSSPPDRRLLAKLTQDPKIIKYLENLSFDITGAGQDDFSTLLDLIINSYEIANAAQASANLEKQAIDNLELSIQALNSSADSIANYARSFSDIAEIVQPPDQMIQGLQRKLDELENLLVEIRTPANIPVFAPSVVIAGTAYTVPSTPSYQPLTIRANATTGGFTITLPGAPALLQLINIKKIDPTANVVTINGGAINIDGAATKTIGVQYVNVQIQFNGSVWDVL